MQLPPSKDHDPSAIAEQALNLGITYFDTAPSYNIGQSETNYGPVVAQRRGELFLATKTGDRSYDGTRRSIEQSLRRLRTDHVDLLQIHGVSDRDDLVAWGKPNGVVSAMRKLRDEKVVRFLGVTGHDSADALRRAIEMYEFDTLLTTLNPVSRRRPYREELLAAANGKKMGVIAMKVMGGGNGCLAAGNPSRKVLRPYHDQTDHQVDPSDLVRYSLGLPVSTAVIGIANQAQLSANVAATHASADGPRGAQGAGASHRVAGPRDGGRGARASHVMTTTSWSSNAGISKEAQPIHALDPDFPPIDEPPGDSSCDIGTQLHTDFQRADFDQLVDRATRHPAVRQIDEVEDHPAGLMVQVAIDDAGPFHLQGDGVAGSPAHQRGKQIAVIGEIVATETAIEIGRQETNPVALRRRADDQPRNFGSARAHPGRLGRIDWERRNVGQEHIVAVEGHETLQSAAKSQDVGVVEARPRGLGGAGP